MGTPVGLKMTLLRCGFVMRTATLLGDRVPDDLDTPGGTLSGVHAMNTGAKNEWI
ncbi:MAG: hypothetical protein HC781_11895 [Leptolyngbyaceae cyanobacterium CSU_1_4]|nr:hypothetical protein [Leptolyngbyaceae cyanobacterium CSU_1_4]